jgi:7,8-dihydropterin-6-yl-methyl-4-(beta-D-ribofuranosyl)aminobenzene 5'-phosphate synthase
MSLRYAVTILVLMCLALMAGCGKSEPTGTPPATATLTGTDILRTIATELPATAPSPSPISTPTETARPTRVASPTPTALTTPQTGVPTPSTIAPPLSLVDRTAADLSQSASKEVGGLTITILYDNNAYDGRLKTEWGFAALVEYGEHTLLFDSGADGPTLLDNMAHLGFDPRVIEVAVISHDHGDHTGGLEGLLDTGVRPKVYVPAAFPTRFKENVRLHTELVEVGAPLEILPGVYSTGELGSTIVEQALVVETQEGIVVITGCAHPGIVSMVRQAQQVAEGKIALVLGGFHLGRANRSQLDRILADFRQSGVKHVAPTHCTGEGAIAPFAEAYGADYIQAGAGRVIRVESGSIGDAAGKMPDYWPTRGWRTSTPEGQGMDSGLLAEMLGVIHEERYDIDSVSVIRNGYLVADATVYPFRADSKHVIRSCTKSLVSALIGIAIEKSYIEGIEGNLSLSYLKRIWW